ncbi:unnamed protein product [Sympodiomycopsis kandeliae]
MATSQHDYGRPSTEETPEDRPLLQQHHDDDAEAHHPASHARQGSWQQRTRDTLARAVRPLSEPDKLGPTEKLLLAASLVLLLLAAIFIGLFAGAQSRLNNDPYGRRPGNGDDADTSQVCNTKECVLASASVLQSLDTSINPCDDFYQFATGGWLKSPEHQIPDDAGEFGTFALVAQHNAQVVKDVLNQAPTLQQAQEFLALDAGSEDDKIDQRNLAKLKTFYDTCMDVGAQDKQGAKPLLEVLGHLSKLLSDKSSISDETTTPASPLFVAQSSRGPPPPPPGNPGALPPSKAPGRAPLPHPPSKSPGPPPSRSPRQKALTSVLAWAHSRGIGAFWDIGVDGDPIKDPTEGTIYLVPGGLGFPDKEYYEDRKQLAFYESVVEDAITAVQKEQKDDASSLKKSNKKPGKSPRVLAKEVVELEKELARLTPDGDVLADPKATYNPEEVNKLGYMIDAVSWPDYLSALTVKVPKKVIVASPSFFKGLSQIISRTRDDVLEAYLGWCAVRDLGRDLGPNVPLRRPAESLARHIRGVALDAKEDRSKVCLSELNEALGFMAGRYFVREAFSPSARDKAANIIKSIVASFKARLPALTWLDAETRKAAEVKADHVLVKVGYPDSPNTTDASSIERYFTGYDVSSGDHFGNRLRSSIWLTRKDLSQAGRKLDRQRWDMFPAEVNAYYNPGGNEIVFPAGILQEPYFNENWPEYMQYGAFGAVSGHELSHAFDPTGRLYDENGYLRDWWSSATASEFSKRQHCLMYQYGNRTLNDGNGKDLPLNPKITIGEDVADAGGVAQSFQAWQNRLSSSSVTNKLLPGLASYTREQLFFISYGITWARNARPEELLRRIRTDPHSPNPWRVNGVVTNFEPFQHAFGCKAGDRLFVPPKERCLIW